MSKRKYTFNEELKRKEPGFKKRCKDTTIK